MPFPSLAVFLFLLRSVASLAAVDLSAVEPSDLVPSPSTIDVSDNSMISSFNDANDHPLLVAGANPPSNDAFNSPPLLAAGATTISHDMSTDDALASGMATGTDGAEVTYSLNDQIPDDASTECLTGTPNARRRMRRGCVPSPDTHSRNESPHNSPGQDGITPNNPNNPPLEILIPPFYLPKLDFKFPMVVPKPEQDKEPGPDGKFKTAEWICDPFNYKVLRFPACDSGKKGADILWYGRGLVTLAVLFDAHPWGIGFPCIEPDEELWCCFKIEYQRDRNLMHDMNHAVKYTGIGCKKYLKPAVVP